VATELSPGFSITPPEPFTWGMTTEAVRSILGIRPVRTQNARYHGFPDGLSYFGDPSRTMAGRKGDTLLAFDQSGGLIMFQFSPVLVVIDAYFEENGRDSSEARALASFWSEVTAGVTARFGDPAEVGTLGPLEPGKESRTAWRDGQGNEVWLRLRREPQFGHYQVSLRYISKRGLEQFSRALASGF
jgi:hypothetical protein